MMQWKDYLTRVAIIGFYKSRKFASQIFALLRPPKTSERFIMPSNVIEILAMWLIGLEAVALVRIKKAIEAVRLRIHCNPLSKQKNVTRKMKIKAHRRLAIFVMA